MSVVQEDGSGRSTFTFYRCSPGYSAPTTLMKLFPRMVVLRLLRIRRSITRAVGRSSTSSLTGVGMGRGRLFGAVRSSMGVGLRWGRLGVKIWRTSALLQNSDNSLKIDGVFI